jgi:hypothetical protein
MKEVSIVQKVELMARLEVIINCGKGRFIVGYFIARLILLIDFLRSKVT